MWRSYEDVEEIVTRYKRREDNSAEELLDSFKYFLKQYLEVISHGKIHLKNKSIRHFVALFMKDGVHKKNINKCFYAPSVAQQATKGIKYIQSLFSIYDEEDIEQYISTALLELANRYVPKGDGVPKFHFYVLKSFHFQLYHSLKPITFDPLYYAMGSEYKLNEYDLIHYDDINYSAIDNKYSHMLMTEPDVYVDDNWVAGFTSYGLFDELSTIDKKIFKLRYVDKKTDGEIAESLTVSRATINRRRLKVKDELEKKFNQLNLIRRD